MTTQIATRLTALTTTTLWGANAQQGFRHLERLPVGIAERVLEILQFTENPNSLQASACRRALPLLEVLDMTEQKTDLMAGVLALNGVVPTDETIKIDLPPVDWSRYTEVMGVLEEKFSAHANFARAQNHDLERQAADWVLYLAGLTTQEERMVAFGQILMNAFVTPVVHFAGDPLRLDREQITPIRDKIKNLVAEAVRIYQRYGYLQMEYHLDQTVRALRLSDNERYVLYADVHLGLMPCSGGTLLIGIGSALGSLADMLTMMSADRHKAAPTGPTTCGD